LKERLSIIRIAETIEENNKLGTLCVGEMKKVVLPINEEFQKLFYEYNDYDDSTVGVRL